MDHEPVRLDDRYLLDRGRIYLSGIQALVRLLLVQARRDRALGLDTAGFVSGYRGSPLGGLDKALDAAGRHLREHRIHFRPGLNEDLAATAVWGSQQVGLFPGARHDGVFALWYGKGPGVDRSGDVFKHANAAGTAPHGGVLAVAGDDHACKSSTLPHQSEQAFIAAMMPVLHPAGIGDLLELGLLGFALSRFSGLWVGFKILADVADSAASVDLDRVRCEVRLPEDLELPPGGLGIRWPDPPLEQERRLLEHRLDAARAFARANRIDRLEVAPRRARIGIAAVGKAWLELMDALDGLGLDRAALERLGVRLFKVAMPWPLEPDGARAFAEGLDEVLVVEEKRALVEDQLKQLLYHLPADRRPRIVGKTDEAGRPLLPASGDLDAMTVARALADRLGRAELPTALRERLQRVAARPAAAEAADPGLVRTPTFCAGCPHNRSTRIPAGARAMAGIGCHYMAIWSTEGTATFTQMGGEGVPWLGQAPFTDTPHVFANLGDGTYQHSGLLAIRAAVVAGATMTYKLLYNDAVAMTGGQPVDGGLPLDRLIRQLEAEGVSRIDLVADDPDRYPAGWPPGVPIHGRDRLDEVQRRLQATAGVSVLIYDQTCATERRRRRKRGLAPEDHRRVVINELVCEGCGDCGQVSNCLAIEPVETEFGRKRRIDQASCNQDRSCLDGFCPSFVTLDDARLRKPAGAPAPALDAARPVPPTVDPDGGYDILIAGVGGTGIVTLAAILGMAAHLEGHEVRTLDQTGLAQKYGAVTSHVRVGGGGSWRGARIPDGRARLLLGADLITAAREAALGRLARDAAAVVDRTLRPTAAFAHDPDLVLDAGRVEQRIAAAVRTVHGLDAAAIAAALGEPIAANLVLLGFAAERGLLPVGVPALERAIRLNGAAVDANLRAFRAGRHAAADEVGTRRWLKAVAPPALSPPPSHDLDQLILGHERFLEAYQDRAWAARYRALIEPVRRAEARLASGSSELADAAARGLFKLMAYKDEYEVARLLADRRFHDQLAAQFEPGFKLHFHLAPTWLARPDAVTGRVRKWRFGPWLRPVLRLIAAGRRLRGTPFDPFGRTAERRLERRLIEEYADVLGELARGLSADNHGLAVGIARLPLEIRGFGPVKMRNLQLAKRREAALLDAWRRPVPTLDAAE